MSADAIKSKAAPRIRAAQIRLLEKLCNASAVSGDEGEVRKIIMEEIRTHADQVETDSLGNLLPSSAGSMKRRSRSRTLATT